MPVTFAALLRPDLRLLGLGEDDAQVKIQAWARVRRGPFHLRNASVDHGTPRRTRRTFPYEPNSAET